MNVQELIKLKRVCQCCREGDKGMLVLHHVNYANYGNESIRDVRLLCYPCHNKLHQLVKGSDPDLKRITDMYIRKKGFMW